MNEDKKSQKCYNSFSCIASIIIILLVLGSIIWDIFITKPAIRNSIEEIKVEIKDIKEKINIVQNDHTTVVLNPDTANIVLNQIK